MDLPYYECPALHFQGNLLEIIVLKYMLPKLPYKIKLKYMISHNPVLAEKINGKLMNVYPRSHKIRLDPYFIEIKDSIIIKEVKKLWKNPECLNEVRE